MPLCASPRPESFLCDGRRDEVDVLEAAGEGGGGGGGWRGRRGVQERQGRYIRATCVMHVQFFTRVGLFKRPQR